MKKSLMVIFVLMCLVLTSSLSFAMTQDELDQQRANAENEIANAEEVTYDTLNENESYYIGKTVKITGICNVYHNGNAMLYGGGRKDKTIVVKVMTYQYMPDVEYTVVGKFAKMLITKQGEKWAVILETTHTPFMSEYGL